MGFSDYLALGCKGASKTQVYRPSANFSLVSGAHQRLMLRFHSGHLERSKLRRNPAKLET